VARFGDGIRDPSGAVDRAALGAIVFADPALRAELEAITHPRIRELMAARIQAALASPAPLVVADIPLLFEGGNPSGYPETLLVYAPQPVQMQRMLDRDGIDEAAALQRLAAQLPIDEKRHRATWVIDNGGTVEATAAQVDSWWRATVG
jgi:dephospho-CoA kinase